MLTTGEIRTPSLPEHADADYARMYYEHQYLRMAKLEDHRLAITNVVLALTAATLVFGFSGASTFNAVTGLGVPAILIAANLFSIAYIRRTRQHILMHQRRAKETLRVYAEHLFRIDESLPMPRGPLFWLGTARMQTLFHVALIIISLLPVCLYISQRVGTANVSF